MLRQHSLDAPELLLPMHAAMRFFAFAAPMMCSLMFPLPLLGSGVPYCG
jgi:hypothetical protein